MGTDTQLNKGVLEGCVLKLLERDFLFSGEIVGKMRASGFSDFSPCFCGWKKMAVLK